ncbi:hypothetical protein AWZ03_012789 [Drosophila navojoa]|uniref:Glycoprotein-N-acetylgalactosamine 3-beta-galactosyltransferase 1 n=1 Tax=Drosophila navojoa TaxID=7232 RepID=A0A484AYV1_DRONA|nr:hypothetical protein AWZ03_012789 [Drosophila navojoa]
MNQFPWLINPTSVLVLNELKSYVFVENMRHMLYPYSPDMPIYFGYNFKLFYSPFGNASYMSGGSGYVLSREALRIFVHGLNDSSKCRQEDNHAEDVEMGVCLYNLGVLAGDSRDSTLRNRFFPMAPYTLLMSKYNGLDFWLFRYAYYNPRACRNCLSDYPVAFHYVSPEDLYVYDYFCYELELYERPQVQERLPEKILPGQLYIPPSDNSCSCSCNPSAFRLVGPLSGQQEPEQQIQWEQDEQERQQEQEEQCEQEEQL